MFTRMGRSRGGRAVIAGLLVAGVIAGPLGGGSGAATAGPTVTATPPVGAPQQKLTVTAQGFREGSLVTFSFDLAVMGSGLANHSGTVSVASEVPPNAKPGAHTVTAAAGTRRASVGYVVRTDWRMQRFGPDNKADNFRENVLSPSSVGGLHLVTSGPAATTGYTPSLVNGILYFADNLNDQVIAMDATSYAVKWTTLSNAPVGFAGSPTVVADAVYTVDGQGGVVAWNIADGTENWFRQLPGGNAHYGATVVNSLVYVQDSGGTFALHAADGSVAWQAAAVGSGLPTVVNGVVYVATTSPTPGLSALNAADGTVIWHYQTDGYALTPVYDGGNLYVATYNQTSHRFAEIAITASTPTLLWSTAINAGPDQPPVVGDGRVYQMSGGQDLRAFSVAQGSVVWADLASVNFTVGPAVANGVLYVASTGLNNTVLALDDSTGGQLSAVDIGGCGASSQAVIANGTVYWGICEDGIATLTS